MISTPSKSGTSGEVARRHRTYDDRDDQGSSPRILIVDDDPEVLMALETYFQMENYDVATADDGARALEAMREGPEFDLVLLDVVLPELNGFEVLQRSQDRGYASPVLMMSGRGDQENILKGFGLGAQDYIVKPFEPDELFRRTEALIGRNAHLEEVLETYAIGSYVIDFSKRKVIRNADEVALSELEIDILRCLIQNRGCVVTKKRLLRDAWHIDDNLIAYTINPDVAIDKVDRTVQSVRTKIEPTPSRPRFIHTVFGLGYRFTEQAESA